MPGWMPRQHDSKGPVWGGRGGGPAARTAGCRSINGATAFLRLGPRGRGPSRLLRQAAPLSAGSPYGTAAASSGIWTLHEMRPPFL
jgi:hypothetical protein